MRMRLAAGGLLALVALAVAGFTLADRGDDAVVRSADEVRASLPLVVIDAPDGIPQEGRGTAAMRIIGGGGVNTVDQPANGYDGEVAIRVRGQSSRSFPKLSYAVETRDADGENRDAGLLGMPSDNDWVLYAGYNDKTLMRNVVGYATAARLGDWAPRTRFVELILDGEYHGVYVLMESVKLDKHRVDLEGEGVEGDYLVEMTYDEQAPRKGPQFRTPFKNRPIAYDDPELEDLDPHEAAYLRGVVGEAELALYGRSGDDWREHLDEDAAVDHLLLQELFKNLDAYRSSTFLHKGAGELLTFGPVWDLDLAMANAARGSVESPEGWLTRERQWASRLHADADFRRALARRWQELREDGLAEEMLATVDAGARELGPAANRNFERWPILDERAWQEPAVRGSFPAEVAALRGWLEARMAWLDAEATRILED